MSYRTKDVSGTIMKMNSVLQFFKCFYQWISLNASINKTSESTLPIYAIPYKYCKSIILYILQMPAN